MKTKKDIQKLTGWSDEKYRTEYSKFSKRVRNFNRQTGSTTSATTMLYNREYSRINQTEKSDALRQIEITPATQAHTRGEVIRPSASSIAFMQNRWMHGMESSPTVARAFDAFKNGLITASEFSNIAHTHLEKQRQYRHGVRNPNYRAGIDDPSAEWISEPKPYYQYE
jgi:hypothetical protein